MCPGSTSASGGSSCSQISPIFRGQRVWKTQPDGGSAALGISPSSLIRSLSVPSTVGTADSSASVYGWCGPRGPLCLSELHEPAEIENRDPVGEVRTTPRSCEMNTYAVRSSRWSSASRFRIAAWTETSRAEVGSSQTTICGLPANARGDGDPLLQPARERGGTYGEIPIREAHRARELDEPLVARLAAQPAQPRQRRPTIRRTVWRWLRAESGFWKTI